jgi:hypothetical protein
MKKDDIIDAFESRQVDPILVNRTDGVLQQTRTLEPSGRPHWKAPGTALASSFVPNLSASPPVLNKGFSANSD